MRAGFDDIDLTTMTTAHLAEYLAQLRSMLALEGDPFIERAIELRLTAVELRCEASRRTSDIERVIALRNATATTALGQRLIDLETALLDSAAALEGIVICYTQYERPEQDPTWQQAQRWRALVAEGSGL